MSMRKKLEHLEELGRKAELGGGEAKLDAQQGKGKLLARQRVALLLDEDSFGLAAVSLALAVYAGFWMTGPVATLDPAGTEPRRGSKSCALRFASTVSPGSSSSDISLGGVPSVPVPLSLRRCPPPPLPSPAPPPSLTPPSPGLCI
mgnify:CR=1 FL=1